LQLRVMRLDDIFWGDMQGMRGHFGFFWKGMLLDNRQPIEGLQIMTSTLNFPNSFPANVSIEDKIKLGSCRRSGIISRFPLTEFSKLESINTAPKSTFEMQIRFYNEKKFQRKKNYNKKKKILPSTPKFYRNDPKGDFTLSEILGKEGIVRIQTIQKPDPFNSDSESDEDSCLIDVD